MKPERKIILAHCDKTKKYFALEAEKSGSAYEAVNFVDLTEPIYSKMHSEISGSAMSTSEKILPCTGCRTRLISSCSCAQSRKRCTCDDPYDYQCIYCKDLVIDSPKGTGKIYVTSRGCDDMAQVLTSLGLSFTQFSGRYDCDIMFLNCLSGDRDKLDAAKLREFVERGGLLYASDHMDTVIHSAFPDFIKSSHTGNAGKETIEVVDKELKAVIGKTVDIEFDLGIWAVISKTSGKVLLRMNNQSSTPVMVMKQYGKGHVFFTSFHNHKQTSDKEKMLLQLLLLKQLSVNANLSMNEMGDLIGLNIGAMRQKFSK